MKQQGSGKMQQQRGFTLIELIIVIVILGILAVTAAPRFIDIQSDATTSTLQGVKASLQSSAQLIYAKAAIAGKQKNAAIGDGDADEAKSRITVNGIVNIELDFGYPDAANIATLGTPGLATDLLAFVELDAVDWVLAIGNPGGGAGAAIETNPAIGSFGISPAGTTPDYTQTGLVGSIDSCHVVYENAANANTPPVITIVSGNC